ncbi:MAG: acyl-CoA thioesterase [Corynebacterium sp.]|uniref:acyl-CoA thioesterase n=1 Tax=Corynebacterium sp. TaxID=1720 RepID=UPI003F108D06
MNSDRDRASTPFTVEMYFRWSDQDPNGHINNARAVTQMEEARVRATRTWLGSGIYADSSRVVRALNAVFDKELVYGPVTGRVWVSRIGRTSYTVSHELLQDGEVRAYGDAVIVVLDPESRRPAPLTGSIRAALEQARFNDER